MRIVAGLVAAMLIGVLAGCTTKEYWAVRNATDLQVASDLRQDPWLAPSETESTNKPLNAPPGEHWGLGSAKTRGDQVRAPLAVVLVGQVRSANRAGWWPYFARCLERRQAAFEPPSEHVQVMLTRQLEAGVLARAELLVGPSDTGTTVARRAYMVSHRIPQPPAPPPVNVTDLECIADDGPRSVGERVGLIPDHHDVDMIPDRDR